LSYLTEIQRPVEMIRQLLNVTSKVLRRSGYGVKVTRQSDPCIVEISSPEKFLLLITEQLFPFIYLLKPIPGTYPAHDLVALQQVILTKSTFQLFPLYSTKNRWAIALGTVVNTQADSYPKNIGSKIRKLDHAFHTLFESEVKDKSIDDILLGYSFEKFSACASKFVPNDNFKKLQRFLIKTFTPAVQNLGIIKGPLGSGKKTTLFHIIDNMPRIGIQMVDPGKAMRQNDLKELFRDTLTKIETEIPYQKRNTYCLIVPEFIGDSVLNPSFNPDEFLLMNIRKIACIIPVIFITTVNELNDGVDFLLPDIFDFMPDNDKIFIGQVIQANFPYIKQISFSRGSKIAEPLASIQLNLNKLV
jgi:hypothetical protein